jgi:hypothetical protein
MKKTFAILPLVVLMTACQTVKPQAESTPASATAVVASREPVLPTEQYDNRAAREQIRRDAQVERSISQAPKWMSDLPISDNAVYANGSAVSTDMSMADYKAKLFAYGKICMAAGGRVNQQSHVFMQDTAEASHETSELAIRAMCPSVDITGTEIKEVKRVSEGGRFRTYVLLALPTGDANQLRKRRDQLVLKQRAEKRQAEVFKEMDQNADKFSETPPATTAPSVQSAPSVQLFPDPTAQ